MGVGPRLCLQPQENAPRVFSHAGACTSPSYHHDGSSSTTEASPADERAAIKRNVVRRFPFPINSNEHYITNPPDSARMTHVMPTSGRQGVCTMQRLALLLCFVGLAVCR